MEHQVPAADLAATLNSAFERVYGAAAASLAAIKELGDLLLETEKKVPRGFDAWVDENCVFSSRMARHYKRIARNWAAIEQAKAGNALPDESLRGAIRLLAKPKPKPAVDWEIRIGESAEVAPPLDPESYFFTIADEKLVVVKHSDERAGHYTISRVGVLRDDEGNVCDVEEEEDVFRPLKPEAVGFWLEQFGCDRSNTWFRMPRSVEA